MTVKDLKAILEKHPDDMEIVGVMYSDYHPFEKDEISVVTAVIDINGEWIMRSHPTMSAENKSREKEYLLFEGN